MALPGWALDHERSLREEAAPYVDMSPAERLRIVRVACRAAARLLRARADAAVALEHVDPLPPSSERILARLRAERRG